MISDIYGIRYRMGDSHANTEPPAKFRCHMEMDKADPVGRRGARTGMNVVVNMFLFFPLHLRELAIGLSRTR